MTQRVFLDANVLFSCASLPGSRLSALWAFTATTLVSSNYAVAESHRNLDVPAHRARLEQLTKTLEIVTTWHAARLPPDVRIAEKDAPILLAAIAAGATHLLTGDRRDFGHLFGKTVAGVEILMPADYLARRNARRG